MLLSFIFDIPIFLPALGVFCCWLAQSKGWNYKLWTVLTLAVFRIVSGGLYFDRWGSGGNHFMWYSWLDTMGLVEPGWIPTPTYQNFFGFWNLLGFFLFLTYPFIFVFVGRWLKGILLGHIPGQTGLWGLLTNR